MNGVTPGQAAYEAFQRAFPDETWGPWERIGDFDDDVDPGSSRRGWEDIAQAAIGAALDDGRVVSLDQHARVVAGSSARITELEVHAEHALEDIAAETGA